MALRALSCLSLSFLLGSFTWVPEARSSEEMFFDREYDHKDGRGNVWASRTERRQQ